MAVDPNEAERRRTLTASEVETEIAALIAREATARTGQLDLSRYSIAALPAGITTMAWLTVLRCLDTQVSDLSPVAELTALTELGCSGTQVRDLAPVARLTALSELRCFNTQVSDLAPVAGLTALTKLDCSGTQVRDLAPVAGLTALTKLDCSFTQVRDLAPVAGLTALSVLNCGSTEVSDLAPMIEHRSLEQAFARNLPNCVVPEEHLSQHFLDNCLPRLRSWWANQQRGREPFRHHKLFLLGNGTVGKTQVARRLRGCGYDDRIKSTHGIQLHDCPLPALADPRHANAGDTFRARLWDFGGQEIYHGTHALFLKTRAIFLICWEADSEAARKHEIGDQAFRNYPLAYWLDYVRNLAGANAQVILVQTQIDKPHAPLQPPIDLSGYGDLTIVDTCRTSAKEGRGIASLKESISTAVGNLERPALPLIGTSERQVLDSVTALRDAGERTLTKEQFEQLCVEAGLAGKPEHLLHFLHHAGELFHADGLFGEQIIIDQRWALDAIYAVFDRDQCWQAIRAQRGRFTLAMLGETVWQKYTDDEREHFLAMMLKCGMVFRYIDDEQAERETVYIAPDLLPEREEESVARWRRRYWDDAAPVERRHIPFPLLHDGLMRAIMRGIGEDAGLHAVYWKNGLLFFDGETGALAVIEADWPKADGWSGNIVITTQRRRATALAERLEEHVREVAERMKLVPAPAVVVESSADVDPQPTFRRDLDRAAARARREARPDRAPPVRPAAAQPLTPICYVSYTRQDRTNHIAGDEHLVDALRREAQARDIDLITYEDDLRAGDTITGFTEEIAKAQIISALIGPHYLRRPHCYHELVSCWAESALVGDRFKRKMRPMPLPGADLYPDHQRGKSGIAIAVAGYWADQYDRCKALEDRDLEDELVATLGKRWATETPHILREIQDLIANYRDFDDYKQQLFAELESMRYRGPDA